MGKGRSTVLWVLAVLCAPACQFESVSAPGDSAAPGSTRSDRLRDELQDETAPTVMVVAHRGCWVEGAPENSLAAIRRCDAIGVDIIEIDVALTSDGTPVLLHDETVDRTTAGSGPIAEMSLDDLRSLRLRSGFGGDDAEITNERIPTLEQALTASRDTFLINLDMKAEAFDRAYEVARSLGVEDQILMKMSALPDDPALQTARFLDRTMFMPIIRECAGEATGVPACSESIASVAPAYSPYGPIAYEIVYMNSDYLREGVASMRAMGGRIWVNTLDSTLAGGHTDALAVDDPDAHWGQVVRDGANIIQTDYPALLSGYLRREGLRSD